jgi:hypothetical protein
MAKRQDIPENSCKFVLVGGDYIADGCNCLDGFEPPPAPQVGDPPESPVYVPCVPIDGGGESGKKS